MILPEKLSIAYEELKWGQSEMNMYLKDVDTPQKLNEKLLEISERLSPIITDLENLLFDYSEPLEMMETV